MALDTIYEKTSGMRTTTAFARNPVTKKTRSAILWGTLKS
jgi:hypothetical protein